MPDQNIPNSVKPLEGNTEPSRGVPPEGVETRRNGFTCKVCKTDKPDTEFYKKDREHKRPQWDTVCKPCRIIKLRQQRLGVTQEHYIAMDVAQGGRCGICKKRLRSKRYKAFCVDHDHATGRIRGLLCVKCNTGLGLFEDNPEYFIRAAEWIKV